MPIYCEIFDNSALFQRNATVWRFQNKQATKLIKSLDENLRVIKKEGVDSLTTKSKDSILYNQTASYKPKRSS